MPESLLPLRIAIVGAGQIGSAFACQLARLGRHDVTVAARRGSTRLQQLRRDGAIIDVKGERAPVSIVDGLDETVPYDLVIVALLAHQTNAVLADLQHSRAACILFMGNTLDPERLQAVGVERCAYGMPFVQAVLNAEGRLRVSIGTGGQKTSVNQERWVDIFNSAGLSTVL
jgi:2-dehydropantoate 2-reductase